MDELFDRLKVLRDYVYMVSGTDITFELIAQVNCVVFLRTQDSALTEPRDKDPTTINRFMSRNFELVTLNGNGLMLVEDVLVDVYMPLLAYFEHRLSYIPSTEAAVEPADQSRSSVSAKSSEGKVSTSTGLLCFYKYIRHSLVFKCSTRYRSQNQCLNTS